MIFSHGLGGSRNAYSHLVGSIASHGVIVIAPEHRDGSAPVSYIREVSTSNKASAEKSPSKRYSRTVDYLRFSHTPSPEVEAGRNAQLKIRLWELGLIHDSILKVDLGNKLTNLNISSVSLSQFKDVMDVHTPGKITFAGHSFGAATITQFVKSTFYSPRTSEAPTDYEPLFTPSSRSSISGQITPQTPIILLDAWCLPLRAEATRWLLELPFPCYAQGGPGGAGLLAVESQAFYKWRAHLKATKRLLSPDPSSLKYDYKNGTIAEPNFFYASTSAHLSQSDFGVLFPWFTKKFLAVEEPERIMRLNVRAVMQLMRNSNIQVSATSHTDMEMEDANAKETNDDKLILGCNEEVRGWVRLTTNVEEFADEDEPMLKGEVENQDKAAPSDAVVGNELMKEKEGTAEKL
jgi:platelet-activating factor acetylhydrolase